MFRFVTNWLDERALARQKERDERLGIAPTQEALDTRCKEAATKGYWKTAQYALEKGADAKFIYIDRIGGRTSSLDVAAIEAGRTDFVDEMYRRGQILYRPRAVEAAIRFNDLHALQLISEQMKPYDIKDAMTCAEGYNGKRGECLQLLDQQLQRKQQPKSSIQTTAAPVTTGASKNVSAADMMEGIAGLPSDAERERLFTDIAKKFPNAFAKAARSVAAGSDDGVDNDDDVDKAEVHCATTQPTQLFEKMKIRKKGNR